MANTRTRWQDLYAIQQDNTSANLRAHVAEDPTFTSADIGVQGDGTEGGVFGLPFTDHPNIPAPSSTIEDDQARGIAQVSLPERNTAQTADPPEQTFPLLADAYTASLYGYSFFQSGVTETTRDASGENDTNLLKCIPYTDADPVVYLQLLRAMQPGSSSDDVDQMFKGAICSNLNFSGETGSIFSLEATLKAAKWEQDDKSGLASNIDFVKDVLPFKYQDMTAAMYDPEAETWVEMFIPSFNVDLENNVQFSFYNDQAAASAIMDRILASGSVTMPWSQADVGKNYLIKQFLEGQPRKMVFYWGQSGDDGFDGEDYELPATIDRLKNGTTNTKNYMSIMVNARISEYDVVGDNEHMVEASFEGVKDENNNSVELRFAYDNTKLERL